MMYNKKLFTTSSTEFRLLKTNPKCINSRPKGHIATRNRYHQHNYSRDQKRILTHYTMITTNYVDANRPFLWKYYSKFIG